MPTAQDKLVAWAKKHFTKVYDELVVSTIPNIDFEELSLIVFKRRRTRRQPKWPTITVNEWDIS